MYILLPFGGGGAGGGINWQHWTIVGGQFPGGTGTGSGSGSAIGGGGGGGDSGCASGGGRQAD